MAEMIKGSTWKGQVTLPPIYRTSRGSQHAEGWRENEMKRLSHVYSGEAYGPYQARPFSTATEVLFSALNNDDT